MSSPPKVKSFFAVTKILSKVQNVKRNWEKGVLVDHLCTLKYFERMIQDATQRHEFILKAYEYMKFKFYPKGTVICHQGNTFTNISILIEGKAVIYGSKSSDEIEPKNHDLRRQHVIDQYVEYIQQKVVKSCSTLTDIGTSSMSIKKGKPITLSKIKDATASGEASQQNEKEKEKEKGNFAEIVEKVLIPKNPILPEFLQESDLSAEEKLLLLANHEQLERYLYRGELTMKPIACLSISDTIGGVSLIKNMPSKQAFVASEDVFILSLAREDFSFLYSMPELNNPQEKMRFLEKIFPDLEREYQMKLAYYLEERVYSSREVIYKEGIEPDAIYMVKNGEVEFTAYGKNHRSRGPSPLRHSDKLSPMHSQATKISITNLQAGSIFGEEEIVYPMLRRTSASARHANTFVYILKKEIFYDMFVKYVPEVANAFKDWIQVKESWRKDQIKDEEESFDYGIVDKKEPFMRPKPSKHKPEDLAESISEKIKNRKNLLKIHASVGLKLPVKAVPMLDLNSVATPRYQERRLKGLNLDRIANLSSNDFRLYPRPEDSHEEGKHSAVSARHKHETPERRSNLFVMNQKILNQKFRPSLSLQAKLLSKQNSPSHNTSQLTPRESCFTTEQGLIFDLKKDLIQNMSGAQSARNHVVDSPRFETDRKLIKDKTLIMLKSYSMKKELPIMKMSSTDMMSRIEALHLREKSHAQQADMNARHKRVRSLGFNPNIKQNVPLDTASVLTGYKTTNVNGTAKKLLTIRD